MKPHFSDLTVEQRAEFGDGCTFVPDFIYTANCRHHDWNYCRGKNLKDKIKADWDMCRLMWSDAEKPYHYIVTVLYWLGLTVLPFSYFFFSWGFRYKTIFEILEEDSML